MGTSKVEYFGKVLIDLTEDTVVPEKMLENTTGHNAKGEKITGTIIRTMEIYQENLMELIHYRLTSQKDSQVAGL